MNNIMKYLLRFRLINFRSILELSKDLSINTGKKSFLILLDMLFCAIRFGATAEDYYKLGFALMHCDMRSTYLTNGVNAEIAGEYNDCELLSTFTDRREFNIMFDKYISRSWIDIENSTKEEYVRFAQSYIPVVIKNRFIGAKSEIRVMNLSQDSDYYSLYNRLVDDNHTIMEQYVKSHNTIAEYCGDALGRISFTTVCKNGTVYFLKSVLKLDYRANSIDKPNLYIFINDDGVTYTNALDDNGKIYEINSATGGSFKNFKIPNFKQTKNFVTQIALENKDAAYVQWNVAITENGAVLIDATAQPDLIQPTNDLCRGENGILSEYRKYIKIC